MLFTKSSFAKGDLFGAGSIGKKHVSPGVSAFQGNIPAPPVPAAARLPLPPDKLVHSRMSSNIGLPPVPGVAVSSGAGSGLSKPSRPGNMVIGSIRYGKTYKIMLADGRTLDAVGDIPIGTIYE